MEVREFGGGERERDIGVGVGRHDCNLTCKTAMSSGLGCDLRDVGGVTREAGSCVVTGVGNVVVINLKSFTAG